MKFDLFQVMAGIVVIVFVIILFRGCNTGGGSSRDNDSWKEKTWEEMDDGEQEKTRDYLQDIVEDAWYK